MSRSRRRPPKVRIIALAAVCCVALFAFSASAFGMPIRGPINVATGPHGAIPAVSPAPVVKAGDNPADRYPGSSPVQTVAFKSGDTPASRVPDPTTTRVVTPFVLRTVVQDTADQTLVIILASLALGVALAGSGFALVRSRSPRAAGMH
jgi:hypothetical protein